MSRSTHSTAALTVGALLALAPLTAGAQISNVERTSVAAITRLSFGHLCEDTFVLRNDGETTVHAALSVERSGQRTTIDLEPREQVKFTSKSRDDVELWVDTSLVARAEKGRKKCSEVNQNSSVVVAGLEGASDDRDDSRRYANYPYYDSFYYGPFGRPMAWGPYPYYWGYRPYMGVPIVIGVTLPPRRR